MSQIAKGNNDNNNNYFYFYSERYHIQESIERIVISYSPTPPDSSLYACFACFILLLYCRIVLCPNSYSLFSSGLFLHPLFFLQLMFMICARQYGVCSLEKQYGNYYEYLCVKKKSAREKSSL